MVPYWDPALIASRDAYISFVKLMMDRHLVVLDTERVADAGVFFVWKKNKKLRLIVDGRPGNSMLPTPPRTKLASPGVFSEVRVPAGQKLYVASLDVENA